MPTPRVQIEVDLTREGLLGLRAQLDALLRDLGGPNSEEQRDSDKALQADRKVGEVWGRVGENIRRLLSLGAQLNIDDHEFSMDQLAQGLGSSAKTVRSWHRNLGRTLRQVDAAMPEPAFMLSRWDGRRQQYRFLPEVRRAILDRAGLSGLEVDSRAELGALEALVDTTPAVVVARAFDLARRRLQALLGAAQLVHASTDPDMYELTDIAARHSLISAQTASALNGLQELRNVAATDPSGTRTTPEKARDFLSLAGAALYALNAGVAS
jgi:hypothetical protein